MSEAIRSQAAILRIELREVFGNRPRLIKAFENLLYDVSSTIPGQFSGVPEDTQTQLAVDVYARRDALPSPLALMEGEASHQLAIQAFLPHIPLVAPVPPDDAGAVLASQVFGG